jgi:magnesium-transporting ATPase (P-type)
VGDVSVAGLTSAEAAERLRRDGRNELPAARATPAWRQLVGQFVHFFAALLWVAGVFAILGGLPELGIAIFAVVVINGLFAFVQEYRAERASQRLRDLVPRRVTVVRDGERTEIDAADLVVGDLVALDAGDRISADLRAEEAHGLLVDESILTGESVAVPVGAGGQLSAGTFVVEGEGLASVTAVAGTTRLGRVAELTRTVERPPTPLARELHRLVRMIAAIAVSVGAGFYGLMLLLGTSATEGFVFAVGVTVALVPEALLPTVTLALAVGAQRMAGRHALVRRLESVETLGSTTFVCTDKTGTLTENRMNVVEIWTPAGTVAIAGHGYEPVGEVDGSEAAIAAARRLAVVARRCSNGRAVERDGAWDPQGDPMEVAVDALARRLGADVDGDRRADPDVVRFAFDPRRRRMSVVSARRVLVKGAPDAVAPVCVGVDATWAAAAEAMSARGLRLLAVARRCRADVDGVAGDVPRDAHDAERDLELLGVLGITDPPRAHALDAIAACRRAGVRVGMITGDHPATAVAIADATGLRLPMSPVLVGVDLPADDVLAATIDRDGVVISRVTPEDKLRILRALQSRGHVVAMTGDGVNDGPALQEADIGVAMGRSGTDVAREAADLVLLDDDFATIVEAIRLGRATFLNARQFLTYHLTDNVAELTPFLLWAVSGGRFPLALGVLQILALDIGTDTLSATALGAEPPAANILDRQPVAGSLLDRQVAWRAFGVLGPVEAVVSILAFIAGWAASGWRPGDDPPTGAALLAASGAAFAAVVFGQKMNAFCCRSASEPVWRRRWTSNRLLVLAVAAELAFAAVVLGAEPIAHFFEQAAPPVAGWLVALAAAPAVALADAAVKRGS